MFQILTLNAIAESGLAHLREAGCTLTSDDHDCDAIILRSHNLHEAEFPDRVQAVARAGAGVNNIPVDRLSEKGIVVFNTPGANANAVKELVTAGLILSSRGIFEGISWARSLDPAMDHGEFHKTLEKEKKQFKGSEITGKTLGVVGLGAIGSLVADVALKLGMKVIGYDPALSVESAWRLPSEVSRMENLTSLLSRSDYITLHLPVLEQTRRLINGDALGQIRPGAVLLNFARDEIIDPAAVAAALQDGRLRRYVTDFPEPSLQKVPGVIATPHIGASTAEAEENCAIMASMQLVDYLRNGNIRNAVNFPAISLERNGGHRLTFANTNVPRILGGVLSILAERNINVIDMINRSRGEMAYNIIDIDTAADAALIDAIQQTEGVIRVRALS